MSINAFTMPIVPILETRTGWHAISDGLKKATISFSWVFSRERYHDVTMQKDAYELRRQFFDIQNSEDALRFFGEFGPYQLGERLATEAKPLTLAQIFHIKERYLDALFHRDINNLGRTYRGDDVAIGWDNGYLWQNLPIELRFQQPLKAIVRCKDVEDALRATVFLDRVRGYDWKRCAREGCGQPFENASKREKIFCSTKCAHLQSVRNYNERKAKQMARAKPVKKRAK